MRRHAFGTLTPEIRLAGNPFDRSRGMQLERQPCDVDESFALQLVDSDRVDIAPGSNVVREDHQVGRRAFGHVSMQR